MHNSDGYKKGSGREAQDNGALKQGRFKATHVNLKIDFLHSYAMCLPKFSGKLSL